jgi:hypothetical protein
MGNEANLSAIGAKKRKNAIFNGYSRQKWKTKKV